MNPAEWLARTARRAPTAPALQTGTVGEANYEEFGRRAAAIGAGLIQRHKIRKGDRVAVFMTNRREYLEVLYGCWFAGAAVVPINAKLNPREASWIIENAGARIAFIGGDAGDGLGSKTPDGVESLIDVGRSDFSALANSDPLMAPVPMAGSDMAWLFYTSGTTGKPKGVIITSANIQAMAYSYFIDVDVVERQDAILYAAPMSHGAGLYNFMNVMKGARHVIPPSGGFEPQEILDLAPELTNVSLFAAPTMVRRLVDAAKSADTASNGIKTVVYGGGPMYLADIVEAVDVMGPKFVQIYGQGESPMTITALPRDLVADRDHPRWRERLSSVGFAQSCVRVRVADEDGNTVDPGEPGEILVEGPSVMAGYWQNQEATNETIRNGWLWTGDLGSMDGDGFVTLQDRSKDLIISGGSNIYPREVEEILLQHPSVHEVAVVGRASPDWGEDVVAFVTPPPGCEINTSALDSHCLENIARFKRPKQYFVVDTLPKNNYGKVLKTELRRRLHGGSEPSTDDPN